jgi:hypothetical protein
LRKLVLKGVGREGGEREGEREREREREREGGVPKVLTNKNTHNLEEISS